MSATGAGSSQPRRPLPHLVERAAEAAFATVATVRRRRALHPAGVELAGDAVLHTAGTDLAVAREAAVEARLSRGIGLPHPLPDFNGVAVRFVDAHGPGRHQDLLLTTSGRRPGLRRLIVPVPFLGSSGYSSVLAHRTRAGDARLIRCEPLPIRRLADAAASLPLILELMIASPRGAWAPAATVVLRSVLPPDAGPRFDPWSTGPELVPSGWLNRLRGPAYAGSRAAAPLGGPHPAATDRLRSQRPFRSTSSG